MVKLNQILPVYVKEIPESLQDGVLYISEEFKTAVHLCACGCKGKSVTPIKNGQWSLTKNGNHSSVTLRPSIGNWSGEDPYHAHYFITDNKIEWL